ncbi:zinc finger protein 862-like [Dreissena polymorpha]|uniref:zinc finger protein 862-like n=1 Tax=Dreissena polymorpha TaxID=45954 RepID=UPI002264FAC2|nr:zinc finger protein 862-like [Dreissena polymorpha]
MQAIHGVHFRDIQSNSIALLKNARVLFIMFDGATDVAVCENEIVYAHVVDEKAPRNVFVSIVNIENAHAEGVLAGIVYGMESVDEKGWHWKEKLIAMGSDGASVNLGKRNSVTKHLKDQIPHLVAMHCVSHRLELGALDAMKAKDAKVFLDLISVLLNLHKHYHYSPKALRELQLLAEAMEEKMIKPVNLQGTRWMPHLSSSLEVLLKQYCTFVAHFENTVEGKIGTVDVQSRAKNIPKHLKSYDLLHYMHFLKDVLSVLSELSLKFQEDRSGLPEALEALETACLQLVAQKQRPGEKLQKFIDAIDDNGKFLGVQLSKPTLTPDRLKERQNSLIDLVIDHINKRMGDIDSGNILKDMQVFYPVNLPEMEQEITVFGESEVTTLCEYYAPVLNR